MGTNYYVVENICECCNRYDEKIHIGKSSHGWTFSFHSTFDCKSLTQWLEYLADKTIYNEYEEEITYDEFTQLVLSKRIEKNNHAIVCKDNEYDKSFLDNEGNSFTEGYFR